MYEEVTYSDTTLNHTTTLPLERNLTMPGMLTRFRIEALHNQHTIDVPIVDNKLILIGENGTGKSTVTNFIYFFLTRQWHRMRTYEFKRVVATIDANDIDITKEDLLKRDKIFEIEESSSLRRFPTRKRNRLLAILANISPEDFLRHPDYVDRYAFELDISPSAFFDLLEHLPPDFLQQISDKLRHINEILEDLFPNRVLYLPTYRRIEQDLSAIFPNLASSAEFRFPIENLKRRAQSASYIELVQFGMQDVQQTIDSTMKNLSDRWRDDLSKLMGTYLRDVIQGIYKTAEPAEIGELDDTAIDAIFNRIDQTVLPQPEQSRLRDMVAKIRVEQYIPDDEDRVVIHFLTRLIKLHKDQQAKEKNAREFVQVCNQYLSGKELTYDNMNFGINIRQFSNITYNSQRKEPEKLEMSMLSSGEKQIVSLFSQIYLSEIANYFVIIDEPELSLSVPWQKRFLPDILNSGRCTGLIAVTHSPFICENELDPYMHSLESYMEPTHASH